jgi:hypothetical protein
MVSNFTQERNIKLMAVLEAYRLKVDNNRRENSNPDHCIRICQAIIADYLELPKRCAERNDMMKNAGLINYDIHTDWKEQYKNLYNELFV